MNYYLVLWVSANAIPHYHKLHSRVIHIRDNRKRQSYQSAKASISDWMDLLVDQGTT